MTENKKLLARAKQNFRQNLMLGTDDARLVLDALKEAERRARNWKELYVNGCQAYLQSDEDMANLAAEQVYRDEYGEKGR
jgi:hypothetical protein